MPDPNAEDTSGCPTCSAPMKQGWVAMWNPLLGQKVRWQPTRPRWRRLIVPDGARVLLKARLGGRDARVAWRCSACATVVVPPDSTYDSPRKP